jgi:hypothetical protein
MPNGIESEGGVRSLVPPANDQPHTIIALENAVGLQARPTGIQLPYPAHHEEVVAVVVASRPAPLLRRQQERRKLK